MNRLRRTAKPKICHDANLIRTLFFYSKTFSVFLLLFLTTMGAAFAQRADVVEIRGRVLDEGSRPIPAATVTVLKSSNATQTNTDGRFVLKNLKPGDSIRVAYMGYLTQVVPARNDQTIILKEAKNDLDEVVVLGYGSQKKSNITGAVSSINMSKVDNVPVTNLSNALAGRAAGVTVTNTSGLAGAASSIRIRGSFGSPLIVIDGIIKTKADFDALDANEIDQMTVLKDAATASVYGSQAGNGVVVVTTKKGSNQAPAFNFQTSYSTARPTQTLLADLTTADDELTYQNRVAQFRGDPLPNGQREFDYFKDKNYNVNDWIWQNPTTQKYLFSVNGGSDKLTYYAQASYTGENGSYKNLDYGKFNLRSNVTAKLSEAISLNLNVSAAQQNHDRFYWPFSGDDDYNVGDFYRVTFNWPKLYPFYTEKDGTPANQVTDFPVQTPMGSWQAWNVIDQVMGDRYIHTTRRQVNSILTMDIKLDQFVKGLSAKMVGNYEGNDYLRKWYMTFQKNYAFISKEPGGNRFIPGAPDPNNTNTFNFSQTQPFLRYQTENGWKYQLDAYLSYKRAFGKHAIDALAVWEQTGRHAYNVTSKASSPLTSIDQMFVYSNDEANRTGSGFENLDASRAWVGKLNYNFDNRYLVDFAFRYDGSTLFSKENRWGFFPSVSLAWRVSQEGFFKNSVSWVDDLKLRVSHGTTGNLLDINSDPLPPFTYTSTYVNSGSYMFGDNLYTTIAPGATPIPNVTWATIENSNIGLDFDILNRRLSGSIEVFRNKMKNILGKRTVTLPDSYGQQLAAENYAQRSFRGSELTLNWKSTIGTEISYGIYGNVGYAKDQWDILDQGADYLEGGSRAWQSAIGQPANRLFGFKAKGIVRTQEELDQLISSGYKTYGRKPYLGAIIYEDVRGDSFKPGADGKIDGNDLQLLSNNNKPRINYGLGFNVSWKGFTIDAHFQGVGAYDRMISNLEGGGMRQHGGTFRTYYPIWAGDVWTPENPDANYPRVTGENWAESGTDNSSFWIRNGAYLRLRNLNVAYNFPQRWLKSVKLSNAQLFFNGTNLLTISDMKEFQDPEQEYYDSFPVMKTFTLGLNLKF
ncbi:TonB-dependent receptor [Pedobacter sp. PLR]|uniref:SusC/RagA family TonB-linked outer membrane protein n=1 Tax=Pedobacter sp. PLR TaxID=2994465 RepID=UPI00224830F6|nr:TonB-dependent receptor [Pedobacter sp. PLR]MCX2452564.1 TonB-dependent receptor [Pedobacter sp. PLR]